MKIAVACDHGGYDYKEIVKDLLLEMGHEVKDCGCPSTQSVDYTDFAAPCAKAVASKEYDRGIFICGTGIGVSTVSYTHLPIIVKSVPTMQRIYCPLCLI